MQNELNLATEGGDRTGTNNYAYTADTAKNIMAQRVILPHKKTQPKT